MELGGAGGRFEVGGDHVRGDAESLLEVGGVSLHLLDAAGGEDDVVAGCREVVGQCLADAGGCARDEGDGSGGGQ